MTRFGYVMATYFVAMGVAVAAFVPTSLKLIWNASPSVPIGLYTIAPADALEVTDLVAVAAPDWLSRFLAARGYLAEGVPLMKRVAALPGQRVCRLRGEITVDGIAMGRALDRDRQGRDLPTWSGCHVVAEGDLFLMNWQSADSFDSRYFGPLPTSTLIGKAMPLYTNEDGDGRFVWRAPTR
ncbi:S26 family signal peptidase [Xanthobacter versatilis]|uniref:S26 family signal peptidase n=1 Tax=Xanthobacter autotrophicus (strain ATCC BAA-1158 / Py2) TaxID=78245 RepID=UPI0037270A9D